MNPLPIQSHLAFNVANYARTAKVPSSMLKAGVKKGRPLIRPLASSSVIPSPRQPTVVAPTSTTTLELATPLLTSVQASIQENVGGIIADAPYQPILATTIATPTKEALQLERPAYQEALEVDLPTSVVVATEELETPIVDPIRDAVMSLRSLSEDDRLKRLNAMKISELQQYLRTFGERISGKKVELINRILNFVIRYRT